MSESFREFRSPRAVRALMERIEELGTGGRFMEVCGTHTMAISRAGLRRALPESIELVSGPGCPVCVTSDRDIDTAIAMAEIPDVTIATFGDMMRVPGSRGSLADAVTGGADVRVVYSPLVALRLARENPAMRVVFLGIGFETTAPAVAATLVEANRDDPGNFFVFSMHKLVPPALAALATDDRIELDGFLLPGHVSVITGSGVYEFLAEDRGVPCVVAGFEPTDILQAVIRLLEMRESGKAAVEIEYSRVVRPGGNPRALEVMNTVFEPVDAEWRGLFQLPGSGLGIREAYSRFDAGRWEVEVPPPAGDTGCRCGDVLKGLIRPDECGRFATTCTPGEPAGPCMVSSEGTCASYYLYERLDEGP